MGFPGSSAGKACSAGDPGLISGSGRSPGEGIGYPLGYSCLENPHGQRNLEGLQSMGSQRAEHDWANKHSIAHIGKIGKPALLPPVIIH